jgi:hypothetical protein
LTGKMAVCGAVPVNRAKIMVLPGRHFLTLV